MALRSPWSKVIAPGSLLLVYLGVLLMGTHEHIVDLNMGWLFKDVLHRVCHIV